MPRRIHITDNTDSATRKLIYDLSCALAASNSEVQMLRRMIRPYRDVILAKESAKHKMRLKRIVGKAII